MFSLPYGRDHTVIVSSPKIVSQMAAKRLENTLATRCNLTVISYAILHEEPLFDSKSYDEGTLYPWSMVFLY